MFSLESFYSVLYSNLLRPANFYLQFFSPFGSTNPTDLIDFSNLYADDNSAFRSANNRHTCIAWDQEPLIPDLVTKAKQDIRFNRLSNNYCYLIANSEKSLYKNEFLRNSNYLDWYYFFHGFAALDWYRDFQYFEIENNFNQPFLSLNRLWKNDRNYRLELVSKFINLDLLSKGSVSLHAKSFTDIIKEISNPFSKLSSKSKLSIYKSFKDSALPFIVDSEKTVGAASASGGLVDLKLNKSALWHIVSETVFYYNKLHLTEKIFKPIVSKRPFILVGATGNLNYLRDYGFQTFDRWIDESYDTLSDNSDRINCIVEQIQRVTSMDNNKLKTMHFEMKEILDYNHDYFYNGKFKYKISKELVDNFKACITAYNNAQGFEEYMVNTDNCNFDKLLSI